MLYVFSVHSLFPKLERETEDVSVVPDTDEAFGFGVGSSLALPSLLFVSFE